MTACKSKLSRRAGGPGIDRRPSSGARRDAERRKSTRAPVGSPSVGGGQKAALASREPPGPASDASRTRQVCSTQTSTPATVGARDQAETAAFGDGFGDEAALRRIGDEARKGRRQAGGGGGARALPPCPPAPHRWHRQPNVTTAQSQQTNLQRQLHGTIDLCPSIHARRRERGVARGRTRPPPRRARLSRRRKRCARASRPGRAHDSAGEPQRVRAPPAVVAPRARLFPPPAGAPSSQRAQRGGARDARPPPRPRCP